VHATVGQVSVYDSGFMLGDGMWEGVRLHQGVLAFVDAHVDRLFENLKAVDIDLCLTKPEVIELVRMLGPLAGLGGAGQGMALERCIERPHFRGVRCTPRQHGLHLHRGSWANRRRELLSRPAMKKWRIVILVGFGTARKRVLERWTNPKPLQPIWDRAAILTLHRGVLDLSIIQ
jgi:hypothetical protein